MAMKIKKQRISFLVSVNSWQEFKWLCMERERTASDQIRILIQTMITRDRLRKEGKQTAKGYGKEGSGNIKDVE